MTPYRFLGPLALFLVWTFSTRLHLVDVFFVPDPISVLSALTKLIISGSISGDLWHTLVRVLAAFTLSLLLGLPLGLLLGSVEKAYRSFEFLIDFFRSTPATALFPLFLFFFGVTDRSKIAVAAFTSLLIIIFNTAHGVMQAKQSRVLAARVMGARRHQVFRWILFWESLPQTCIGLRSAVSLSLVIIIVTEMFVGTTQGLGRKIIDAQITYEIPTMYAVILLSGIVGYLLNFALGWLERRYVHWGGK